MQFDHVEAPGSAGPPACAQCRRPLDEYFALGGHMFCRTCIDAYKTAGPLWRALLFGAGGALVGAIGASIFYAATNSTWGFVGIVVGLLVGYGVRKGSRGRGGWKLQALAMVLTYASIRGSYIPLLASGDDSPEYLFLFGRTLVMPFVGETSFIGCIIIAIALYEAWKLNRRVPIEGPFRFGGALSVPAPAPVTPGMAPPAAGL